MKYTNEDVENRVSNIVALMYKLGLLEPLERPVLVERESSGGVVIPWRMFIRDTRMNMGGHYSPGILSQGFLGNTNREACERAEDIARVLQHVYNERDKIRRS